MPRKKKAAPASEQLQEEQALERPMAGILPDEDPAAQPDVEQGDEQAVAVPAMDEAATVMDEPGAEGLAKQEVAPTPDASPDPAENAPTLEDAAEPESAQTVVAEAPASQPLQFNVRIHPESEYNDILSTADVEIAGVGTIRNVKIKSDDYGVSVVMPRTKVAAQGQFKDSFFFEERALRDRFDAAVLNAYNHELAQNMESGRQLENMDDEPGYGMEQTM